MPSSERPRCKRESAEPKICREQAKIHGDMVSRATGMLTAASIESVKTLLELQKNGTPAFKLGAAKAVIELSTKLWEVVDLEAKMLELEAKVEAINEGKGPGQAAGRTNETLDDVL